MWGGLEIEGAQHKGKTNVKSHLRLECYNKNDLNVENCKYVKEIDVVLLSKNWCYGNPVCRRHCRAPCSGGVDLRSALVYGARAGGGTPEGHNINKS